MEDADFLVQMFPLRAVPSGGAPQPQAQIEYLAAGNGLWRSITNPWLRSLTPLATSEGLLTPFGPLQEVHEIRIPAPPASCWKAFLLLAKQSFPKEAAAWFVWNPSNGSWRFAPRIPVMASGEYIEYREPGFEEGEIPVVDIHSHGRYEAFFSDTDDRDDKGSLKLAVVIGNIDQPTCTIAGRAVLLDNIRPLIFLDGDRWAIGQTHDSHHSRGAAVT